MTPQDNLMGKSSHELAFSSTNTESARTVHFYADLKPFDNFSQLTHFDRYLPLPHDWFIGVADVVQSTTAIKAGRYKAVNTVGAAVLVAITNALPQLCFPYVFGGDGATRPRPAGSGAARRPDGGRRPRDDRALDRLRPAASALSGSR